MGLRVDRILYRQFQEICVSEKLRPGEAVESLIRLVVQAGSVSSLYVDHSKHESSGNMIDDALFKSRLTRLKTSLELEQNYFGEIGDSLDYDESTNHIEALTQIGRRSVNPELVKEFQECLSTADKQYQELWKTIVQKNIEHKRTRDRSAEKLSLSD